VNRMSKSQVLLTLIVALIAAVATIIGGVLSNERFADRVLSVLETERVEIPASREFSGAAIYYSGDDLLTFAEVNNISGAGDTDQDQLIRSFLSFYLGDIPPDATIVEAEILLSFSVTGHPESLGALVLTEYPFGQYTQGCFNSVPTDTWHVSWADWPRRDSCAFPARLTVSGRNFTSVLQRNLAGRWIQLAFSFENDWILSNKDTDAVLLCGPPTLIVTYREQQ
jgi:hypothetical protein